MVGRLPRKRATARELLAGLLASVKEDPPEPPPDPENYPRVCTFAVYCGGCDFNVNHSHVVPTGVHFCCARVG